jgi:hypothetical protein
MATLTTQVPTLGDDITPTGNATSAADKFAATGGRWILYYKGGASTAVTTIYALNANTAAPTGTVPAAGTGGTNPFDLRLSNGISGTIDAVCVIDNAATYTDATGFVNLKHNGTLTGLTVSIFGPF